MSVGPGPALEEVPPLAGQQVPLAAQQTPLIPQPRLKPKKVPKKIEEEVPPGPADLAPPAPGPSLEAGTPSTTPAPSEPTSSTEPGTEPGPALEEGKGGGMSFVSPSIRQNMSYRTATRALKSGEHSDLRDFKERMEKEVAKTYGTEPGKISDIIGDWADAAENSHKTEHNTPQHIRRVMSALEGLHAAQKQVADFHYGDETSPHSLFHLRFNEDDPEKVRKVLDEHGLQYRSISPKVKKEPVTAHIIDTDGGAWDGIEALVKSGHLIDATRNPGTAEFNGDQNAASRETAAGEYRRILQEARDQAGGEGHRGDEFRQLTSWLDPFQEEAERHFAELRDKDEFEKQEIANDYKQAAVHRSSAMSPEEAAILQDYNLKGKDFAANQKSIPPTSKYAYLLGKRNFPRNDMRVTDLGEYFDQAHPTLDYDNPAHREKIANAQVSDIMHALAGSTTGGKPSEAYGWYGRTVRESFKKLAEVAPEIQTDPAHSLAMKLGLAVTSQGQKVPINTESGWHVYQYWKKHGKLPEDSKYFGGGTKADQMVGNFVKLNKLWKDLGTDGLLEMLQRKMTVRQLKDDYHLEADEHMDHEVRGAMGLGAKIGAYLSNLFGHFDASTWDLWAARDFNMAAGNMFNFSEDAMKKGTEEKDAYLKTMRTLLDEHPEELTAAGVEDIPRMREELAALEAVPPAEMTRPLSLKLAPTIYQWAKQAHKNYSRSYGQAATGEQKGSYHEHFKTRENLLAKNFDENANEVAGGPRNASERDHWRDIAKRVHNKLLKLGIELNNSDKQALNWFDIKDVFKKAGANAIPNVDYLDAAYSLVRHVKNGMVPDLTGED